jgi:hypothetical protein
MQDKLSNIFLYVIDFEEKLALSFEESGWIKGKATIDNKRKYYTMLAQSVFILLKLIQKM